MKPEELKTPLEEAPVEENVESPVVEDALTAVKEKVSEVVEGLKESDTVKAVKEKYQKL